MSKITLPVVPRAPVHERVFDDKRQGTLTGFRGVWPRRTAEGQSDPPFRAPVQAGTPSASNLGSPAIVARLKLEDVKRGFVFSTSGN